MEISNTFKIFNKYFNANYIQINSYDDIIDINTTWFHID